MFVSIPLLLEQAWSNHRDLTVPPCSGATAGKETRSRQQEVPQGPKNNYRAGIWVDQGEPGLPQVDRSGAGEREDSMVVALHDHKFEKTLQLLAGCQATSGGSLRSTATKAGLASNMEGGGGTMWRNAGAQAEQSPENTPMTGPQPRVLRVQITLLRQPHRCAPTGTLCQPINCFPNIFYLEACKSRIN